MADEIREDSGSGSWRMYECPLGDGTWFAIEDKMCASPQSTLAVIFASLELAGNKQRGRAYPIGK